VIDVLVGLGIGTALGAALGWLLAQSRSRSASVDLEARARMADELRARMEAQQKEVDAERAARQQAEAERVEARTRMADLQQVFEEKRRLLDEAAARLADTFKALSADALRSNNQTFLQVAQETLRTLQARAEGSLDTHRKAVELLVKPLEQVLLQYRAQVEALEQSRKADQGALVQHLKTLAEGHQRLQTETANLVTALRAPQVRGRWGELTLRRVAELAGLSEHCDFTEQATVAGEQGALRPDMIVHLPGGRDLVVDAKAVFDAYYQATEAQTDEERRAKLEEHARQLRSRVRALASKDYARQFETPPEFVILFLPGESFFSAALASDRTLIEDAIQAGVFLATPTTLIALMKAVAYGWRQEQAERNAVQIRDVGRELHERLAKFAENLKRLGDALEKGVEAYNVMVGSVELRVLPAARKLKDLGADSGGRLAEPGPVDDLPRPLAAPEFTARDGKEA
jgi:DNA recombination protein RmuC